MASLRFRGLAVCGGVAFGRAHVVDRRSVSAPHYRIQSEKRGAEVERFEQAIEVSKAQFAELRGRAVGGHLKEVEMLLQAHAMLLEDDAFREATRQRILTEGQNAEWALKDAIRKIKDVFDKLDEDYFRERMHDIDSVGDRVLRNLVGAETELLDNLSEDAVVVAYDLSPADTVALAKFSARAFVMEGGGRTSHTAILARALGVPSVLRVQGIMERVGTGDEMVVDGYAGEVVLRPTPAASARFRGIERRRLREEEVLLADRDLPAETTDGVRVQLFGNIEVAQEIESVLKHGGEGIGLYRTEFLLIERPWLESHKEHFDAYRAILAGLDGREVTIRTVDAGGDKFLRRGRLAGGAGDLDRDRVVMNPALGLRAIRLSLSDVPRFKEQLMGILLASVEGNVRVLLPFVTGVEELRQTKAILEEAKQDLAKANLPFDAEIPVGVMIETPAAVFVADLLAKEADFFAIGTNDLIQYSLAIDRSNERVAHLHRPSDPAVLRMLLSVVRAGRAQGIPVSICGEMAAVPFYVPLLIGLGLTTLSMSAKSIPVVKRLVRRVAASDCVSLVETALGFATADEVERELADRLRAWAPDLFGVNKVSAGK